MKWPWKNLIKNAAALPWSLVNVKKASNAIIITVPCQKTVGLERLKSVRLPGIEKAVPEWHHLVLFLEKRRNYFVRKMVPNVSWRSTVEHLAWTNWQAAILSFNPYKVCTLYAVAHVELLFFVLYELVLPNYEVYYVANYYNFFNYWHCPVFHWKEGLSSNSQSNWSCPESIKWLWQQLQWLFWDWLWK